MKIHNFFKATTFHKYSQYGFSNAQYGSTMPLGSKYSGWGKPIALLRVLANSKNRLKFEIFHEQCLQWLNIQSNVESFERLEIGAKKHNFWILSLGGDISWITLDG